MKQKKQHVIAVALLIEHLQLCRHKESFLCKNLHFIDFVRTSIFTQYLLYWKENSSLSPVLPKSVFNLIVKMGKFSKNHTSFRMLSPLAFITQNECGKEPQKCLKSITPFEDPCHHGLFSPYCHLSVRLVQFFSCCYCIVDVRRNNQR